MNFVFGKAYGCAEGYTPLMSAAHRGRMDACKALLRSGADPNYMNSAGDLTLFWGIDGGVEIIKCLYEVRWLRGAVFESVWNLTIVVHVDPIENSSYLVVCKQLLVWCEHEH